MTSAYSESLALTQDWVTSIGPAKEVATMDRERVSGEIHRNRMMKYGRRSREYGIEIAPSLSSSLQRESLERTAAFTEPSGTHLDGNQGAGWGLLLEEADRC